MGAIDAWRRCISFDHFSIH